MMNARRLTRNIKPDGALEIDWSHPLAADLLVAVCPGEGAGPLRELVTGNYSTAGANGSWSSVNSGRAVSFTATQYNVMTTRPLAVIGAAYTVLWGGRFKTTSGGWDNWGGLFCLPSNARAKSFLGLQRDAGSDSMQLFHNDTAGITLNSTINANANKDLVIAATWDGSTIREFLNGKLVQTKSPTYVPTGTPDNKLHINSERGLAAEAAQTLSFFYLFKRRLPDALVAELSDFPFQLLRPRRSLPLMRTAGAGGGVTLVTADAVQTQGGDAAAITQQHGVTPADSTQAQNAEAAVLSQGQAVTPHAAGQEQRADMAVLTQLHLLSGQDARHAFEAEVAVVGQGHLLEPHAAGHAHFVNSVLAGSNAFIVIGGNVHGQSADLPVLWQQHLCQPAAGRLDHFADATMLTGEGAWPPSSRTRKIHSEPRRVAAGRRNPVLKPARN